MTWMPTKKRRLSSLFFAKPCFLQGTVLLFYRLNKQSGAAATLLHALPVLYFSWIFDMLWLRSPMSPLLFYRLEALMRLQKYLASCGAASRRAAEQMIADGRVTVDGEVVTAMGTQVQEGQTVCLDGRVMVPESQKYYIMYHKPAGEVTTAHDSEGRATVLDKFSDFPVRLYPVGRLDYDSEGLLLLTNDGDLTKRMLHPSCEVDKVYLTRVSKQVTAAEAHRLESGVMVDGKRTANAKVKLLNTSPMYTDMLITIHEGRNRQVRKMVEQVGHQVVLLRRIRFGPLKLGDLPRGMWRELTAEEQLAVNKL